MKLSTRDLLRRIDGKCQLCKDFCFPLCPLYPIHKRGESRQDDLFKICDIDCFFAEVKKAAKTFGNERFWWSELRKKVKHGPINPRWWGLASRHLNREGWVPLDKFCNSPLPLNKGALERAWRRQ